MPTIDANPPVTETRACPLCGTALSPEKPDECSHCDWTRGTPAHHGTGRDLTAVCLSVLPGFGHIYKGHRLLGALLMYLVTALFIRGAGARFALVCGLMVLAVAHERRRPSYWAGRIEK